MSRSKNKPIIGITMGDPQGIGPEIIQKAFRSKKTRSKARFILFGEKKYFGFQEAKRLSPKECGRLSFFYLEQAAHAALTKQIDAIVTAPICKERWFDAGIHYPGHTEYLAEISGVKDFRMMMAGPSLRVVLDSIHLPLKKIPAALSISHLAKTIQAAHDGLKKWFGIKKPRLAVAALNPHAGEGGIFGDEEKRIIGPAAGRCRKAGIDIEGPFSPDTVFYRAHRGEFDAVIAVYHDQGLIPVKLLHFHEAVNMTLGLPFVRTSVDHGVAFDIAGKGVADERSMVEAIKLAAALTRR